MATDRPLYVTTAIPYVNARPHLGFAFEVLLADVIARRARREGRAVRFVSGTDENSLKNALAAGRAGVALAPFVERNAEAFRALGAALGASYDDFVRTGVEPRHRAAVEALWSACRHDLYRARYRGLYCAGCEAFRDPDEGDACPEHEGPLEEVDEENWFFRLSRHERAVRDALGRAAGADAAAGEVRALLARGLRDVSVSRDARRARGVGLAVPGDPSQIVYVWFDALSYYFSGLARDDADPLRAARWAGAERAQVFGKGVARFHVALWPALLASAGLPPPDRLLAHGYLTIDGRKISKSGASADPGAYLGRYGVDGLRLVLLRNVKAGRDGDASFARFDAAYNADLANGLGNLVGRTTGLLARLAGGRAPAAGDLGPAERALAAEADALAARVGAALDRFAPDEALDAIFALASAADGYIDRAAPWALARAGDARLPAVLATLAATLRALGDALAPFAPATSAAVLARLGAPPVGPGTGRFTLLAPGTPVTHGPALFPRLLTERPGS